MTLDAILIALFTGFCGLTLILGIYELTTGQIPGNPVERGVWGYRWISTPLRLRLVSMGGLLVLVGFLVLYKPFSLADILIGGIGVILGVIVVVSDARSRR